MKNHTLLKCHIFSGVRGGLFKGESWLPKFWDKKVTKDWITGGTYLQIAMNSPFWTERYTYLSQIIIFSLISYVSKQQLLVRSIFQDVIAKLTLQQTWSSTCEHIFPKTMDMFYRRLDSNFLSESSWKYIYILYQFFRLACGWFWWFPVDGNYNLTITATCFPRCYPLFPTA